MAKERKYLGNIVKVTTLEDLISDLELLKNNKATVMEVVAKAYNAMFGSKAAKSAAESAEKFRSGENHTSSYNNFFPKGENELKKAAVYALGKLFKKDFGTESVLLSEVLSLKQILSDCRKTLKDNEYQIPVWKWSADMAWDFYNMDRKSLLNNPENLKKYRKVMDKACQDGDDAAKYVKAYDCYGGNEIYKCNWKLSEQYFVDLLHGNYISDEEKGFIANSLGYIYYYGRHDEGIPDFEKALKYYTIGSNCGVMESIYKLGDMELNGLGLPKNIYAAFCMYTKAYNASRHAFEMGDFQCKLADTALRMGNLCENGFYLDQDPDMAYYFYTIADYAIKKRQDHTPFYGDEIVKTNINRSITRIRTIVEGDDPDKKEYSTPFPEHTIMLLEGGNTIEVSWESMKDTVKLTSKRIPDMEDEPTPKLLVVHAEAHYAELTDTVVEFATGIKAFRVKGNMKTFKANCVNLNKNTKRFDFFYNGELMACIDADSFTYRMDS